MLLCIDDIVSGATAANKGGREGPAQHIDQDEETFGDARDS
jgi:hypothetical protein